MSYPSNFDEELRKSIKLRLDQAAENIVVEEVQKIMGRVKIFVSADLRYPLEYNWMISSDEGETK